MEELLNAAQYDQIEIDQIVSEYHSFKSSLKLLTNCERNESQYIKVFQFLLFKRHECREEYICNDNCPLKDQIEHPEKANSMTLFHLSLREKELYEGISLTFCYDAQ